MPCTKVKSSVRLELDIAHVKYKNTRFKDFGNGSRRTDSFGGRISMHDFNP